LKLTTRQCETAKAGQKEYLLGDGQCLHLRVRPDGAKNWLFVYVDAAGKRKKHGLGVFPTVAACVRTELDSHGLPDSATARSGICCLFNQAFPDDFPHISNAKERLVRREQCVL